MPPPQPFAAQTEEKDSPGASEVAEILDWVLHGPESGLASASEVPPQERTRINDMFMETAGRTKEADRLAKGNLPIPSPPRPFLYPLPPHPQPYKIYVRTYVRT